jgi:hypothetical protein
MLHAAPHDMIATQEGNFEFGGEALQRRRSYQPGKLISQKKGNR